MTDESAHVSSIAAIQDFRNALVEYVAESKQGLVALDLEIRRGVDWVRVDRAQYWRGEVRRAMEVLARAKDDYHNARTFKTMNDHVPSCIDEKKAIERAERRLRTSEQKSEAVRKWSRTLQHELNEFAGRMSQVAAVLEGDMPRAMAALDRLLNALDRYVSTSAPGSMSESQIDRVEAARTSMARPVDEIEREEAKKADQPAPTQPLTAAEAKP